MPAVSIAQMLPAPILDAIVRHVPSVLFERHSIYKEEQLPRGFRLLIPLMQMCRSWRPAACAEVFSKAIIKLSDQGSHGYFDNNIVRVENAIAGGCQNYIRSVVIVVSVENFNRDWNLHTRNMASIIRDCELLQSVKTVMYYFTLGYARNRGKYVIPDLDRVCNDNRIANNIELFAGMVKSVMPGIRNVCASDNQPRVPTLSVEHISNNVLKSLTKLVDVSPAQLTLIHINPAEEVVASPATATLQCIVLSSFDGRALETVLVQRNAPTLEKLHLETTTVSACRKLVQNPDKLPILITYPRLKHLIFRWVDDQHDAFEQHPAKSPFPRLETLICCGAIPFTAPSILMDCQTSLRHLEIEVDQNLLAAYDSAGVLAKDMFVTLNYVSLKRHASSYGGNYNCNWLFCKSAELSSCLRTLCLREMRLENVNQLVANVRFPQTLKALDMANTQLNIDDAIAILSRCPQVVKANLSLADSNPGRLKKLPIPEEIVDYQKKYQGCAARVKYLGIRSWSFGSIRRVAEYIVLLIDVIPSVTRVSFSSYESGACYSLIENIHKACRRSVYKGHSWLDSVVFSADNCW